MTKKHFEAIAALFSEAMEKAMEDMTDYSHKDTGYIIGRAAGIEAMAEEMADYFALINPNFNRDKFLDACGMGS